MDVAVVVALTGAGAGIASALATGPVAAHVMSRRLSRAQVQLIQAQADDLETQVYERVVSRLRAELEDAILREQRLERRVGELEEQVARLRAAGAAAAERERQLGAELATARQQRDQARRERDRAWAALAEREAEIAAAWQAAEDLHTPVARRPAGTDQDTSARQ